MALYKLCIIIVIIIIIIDVMIAPANLRELMFW